MLLELFHKDDIAQRATLVTSQLDYRGVHEVLSVGITPEERELASVMILV